MRQRASCVRASSSRSLCAAVFGAIVVRSMGRGSSRHLLRGSRVSVTPLPLGSGVQYESRVSLGYLNQSFQNAVRDGIRYGLEQGLFGWNVTDCKICFEYGLYYSPVSTPADFRSLAPIVLEQALKESGTQLLEPYLSFTLYGQQ